MDVRFTHPRTSDTYLADINPQITAKQVIGALCGTNTGPFLQPLQSGEDYRLIVRRTNLLLAPDTTLGSAGVISQDVLDVVLGGSGA